MLTRLHNHWILHKALLRSSSSTPQYHHKHCPHNVTVIAIDVMIVPPKQTMAKRERLKHWDIYDDGPDVIMVSSKKTISKHQSEEVERLSSIHVESSHSESFP
ncbi:hypothetical protein U1Q18_019511 [Sarracenia purpurea var. burkii]